MGIQWNTEEIFTDGDVYFERLLKDIDEAQHYITVEMYIFNNDILGKKISAHLIAAHQRGVRVQIIVEAWGAMPSSKSSTVSLKRRESWSRCTIHFPSTIPTTAT
jgi:cardiolipin synthase A/B